MINNTEQNKQPALIDIKVPSINESGYASALNDAFKNIDNNFETLSNYDFIKGESGTSVSIKETPFYNADGKLSYYGEQLISCIKSLATDDEMADVETADGVKLNLFDNFTNDNAGSICMIYSAENDLSSSHTPVSSLYYIFLDGRYAPKNSNLAEDNQYVDKRDLSCIVVYDSNTDGGFKVLSNAFPTMYYENGVGLCWKINGSQTGLSVRGVPGKNGLNAKIHTVMINTDGSVKSIYESHDGYVNVEEIDNLHAYDNQ